MAEEPAAGRSTDGRGAAAVRRQEARSRCRCGRFASARRRRPAAHGPGRTHRQGGDPGGRRQRPGRAGLCAPRGRHVPGHRRLGRLGPETGPLAGRSRRAPPGPAGPVRRLGTRPRRNSKPCKRPAFASRSASATWAIGRRLPACWPTSPRNMPPLRGIFHLAGVLDDGVLREQTRERFDRVMAAKVLGAWNLHELTRERAAGPVRALLVGRRACWARPGQGNYAAANAFLDALAHHRRWQKLPALSVNWGSWAEVGMAARLKETEGATLVGGRRRLDRAGPRPGHPGTPDRRRSRPGRRAADRLAEVLRADSGGQRAGLAGGDRPRGPRRRFARRERPARCCWRNCKASRPPSGWKWP